MIWFAINYTFNLLITSNSKWWSYVPFNITQLAHIALEEVDEVYEAGENDPNTPEGMFGKPWGLEWNDALDV